jgi:hypothetical protein
MMFWHQWEILPRKSNVLKNVCLTAEKWFVNLKKYSKLFKTFILHSTHCYILNQSVKSYKLPKILHGWQIIQKLLQTAKI